MLATFFEPRRPKTPTRRPQDAAGRPQATPRLPKTHQLAENSRKPSPEPGPEPSLTLDREKQQTSQRSTSKLPADHEAPVLQKRGAPVLHPGSSIKKIVGDFPTVSNLSNVF